MFGNCRRVNVGSCMCYSWVQADAERQPELMGDHCSQGRGGRNGWRVEACRRAELARCDHVALLDITTSQLPACVDCCQTKQETSRTRVGSCRAGCPSILAYPRSGSGGSPPPLATAAASPASRRCGPGSPPAPRCTTERQCEAGVCAGPEAEHKQVRAVAAAKPKGWPPLGATAGSAQWTSGARNTIN